LTRNASSGIRNASRLESPPAMPVKKPYRIGRSPTGLGLFAVTPIRKRQFIVQYSGRVITSATADKLERYRRNKFLFELNKQWCIDGVSRRNIGRYVNHSCRPNAEAVIRRGGIRRIDYVAARKIKPGEEITVDYGKDYTEMFIESGGCRCAPCRRRRARKRKLQRALAKRRARSTRRRPRATGRTLRSPGSKTRTARPSRGRTRLAAG
jgi:hypothetical protein